MRCARLTIPESADQETHDEFLRRTEPDLLQFDFVTTSSRPDILDSSHANPGFHSQLRVLYKHLFLHPEFRLVTNAGGEDIVGCMEVLAGFLCEHDGANLPVAAIRGHNLLPRLDQLLDQDVKLVGEDTAVPLGQIADELIALDVQLGAGPLAMALHDEARIIVAGSYDSTSPFIAGEVVHHNWLWESFDQFAQLAYAVEEMAWLETATNHRIALDVDDDGTVSISLASLDSDAVESIQRQLQQRINRTSEVRHADVVSRFNNARLELSDAKVLTVRGCQGRSPEGLWPVNVIQSTGFGCVVLIESTQPSKEVESRHVIAPNALNQVLAFCEHSCRSGQESEMRAEAFQSTSTRTDQTASLIRIDISAKTHIVGERLIEELAAWLAGRENLGIRLAQPTPQVQQLVNRSTAFVPADVVPCSVDTRPAQEWL